MFALLFMLLYTVQPQHSCAFTVSVHFILCGLNTAQLNHSKLKGLPLVPCWTVYPAIGLSLFALQTPQ